MVFFFFVNVEGGWGWRWKWGWVVNIVFIMFEEKSVIGK